MFDLVQKNKTVVQVVLGLVSLGLVVGFGLSGYSAMEGGPSWLAKVGGKSITEQDIAEATRGQVISDDMKPMVLQELIRKQLLLNEAHDLRLSPSTQQLQKAIAAIPAFQDNGQFSPQRYQELLGAQQISPTKFEGQMRDDLATRQLLSAFMQSGMTSSVTLERLAKLMGEKREVSSAVLKPEAYLSQVTVSDAEVKQYYDQHQADLKAPEMVRVEYVALSKDQLAQQQVVSDEEIQKYFDAHKDDLAKEERQAAHILIAVPKGASAADKQAAKAKAEDILKQVKANPARFAELAKADSQDPGSKDNGGDLGWFARGAMVKPFEDTVFKLQKDQVSDLVETDFGYHIIKLEGVRTKTLADLKPEIADKLKSEKGTAGYQAQADKFNELVYQQADSLKPAADQFKLQVQQSGWITRKGTQDPLLNNPKLEDAIFGDDVLKKKHNSEAIEVVPGTLVSARVIEHKDAQIPPLPTVAPDIQARLKHDKAVKLAAADGAKKLAALQKGETVDVAWDAQPKEMSRIAEPSVATDRLHAIFAAPAHKLPAFVGGDDAALGGYVLYKVGKVIPAPTLTPEMRQQIEQNLGQMYGQAELTNYFGSLQKKAKIELRAPAKAQQ